MQTVYFVRHHHANRGAQPHIADVRTFLRNDSIAAGAPVVAPRVDQEQRPVEPHDTIPILILRPVRKRLHDREQRRKPECQGDEVEVELRRIRGIG